MKILLGLLAALAIISIVNHHENSDAVFCNQPDMVATFAGRGGYDECVYIRAFYAKSRKEREARWSASRRYGE
jgi:hypothetical protein